MHKYWIIANGIQEGPMTLQELASHPAFGPDAPVWREGLPDWTTASRLPETAALLNGTQSGTDYYRQEPFTARYAPGGPSPVPDRPMPNTYLVWAIISCLCCCMPAGIVAIIYASKVAPRYNNGDYWGAKQASEKAGWWVIISVILSLIAAPFSIIWSMLTM